MLNQRKRGVPEGNDLVSFETDVEALQRVTTVGQMLIQPTGDHVAWDDLQFPATAVNPPGQASDPDWDPANGGWLFDPTSTELLYLIAQMPHAWKEGSEIEPHVHWQKTTSAVGNVLWRLNYRWARIGEVWDAAVDIESATPAVTDGDTANQHALTPIGTITPSTETLSDMLVMKIARIGGDALDTYGGDCRLLEFDIHYQIDSRGSRQEYAK